MTINLTNYESYLLDYLEGNLSNELLVEMEMFLVNHPEISAQIEDRDLPKLTGAFITSPDFSGLSQALKWNESEVETLILNSIENQLEENDLKRLAQFKAAFPEKVARLEKLLAAAVLPNSDVKLDEGFLAGLEQVDFNSSGAQLIAFAEGDLTANEQEQFMAELASNPELSKELKIVSSLKLSAPAEVKLPSGFINDLKQEKKGILIPLWVKSAAGVAAAVLIAFLIPFGGSEEPVAEYSPRLQDENLAETENTWRTGGTLKPAVPPLVEPTHQQQSDFVADVFLKAYENTSTTISLGKPKQDPESTRDPIKRNTVRSQPELELMKSRTAFLTSDIASVPAVLDFEDLSVDFSFYEESLEDLAELDSEESNNAEEQELIEFAENQAKEKLGAEENENLAVALLNTGAKKLLNKEEDVLVYEKNDDQKGFKFSLGRFSIESTK